MTGRKVVSFVKDFKILKVFLMYFKNVLVLNFSPRINLYCCFAPMTLDFLSVRSRSENKFPRQRFLGHCILIGQFRWSIIPNFLQYTNERQLFEFQADGSLITKALSF